MKKTVFILHISLFFLAWAGSGPPARGQSTLSPKIKQLFTHNRANNAFWSLTVRDSSGAIIESYNSKRLIRPASNLKLLTAATVLNELGANFTYKTPVYGTGRQNGEVWNGNIIIRGEGDPSLSGRFYEEDRLRVMQELFHLFEARGITKIKGNLIGNDAYFDEQMYPDGWSWDDLSFYYAVPINALSFNNNTVDLTVYARGAVGDMPDIEWFPFDTDYVNFVNEQRITPVNASYDEFYKRLLGTNTIILRSSLPKGYVEKEALSVADPPLFFIDTFKKYLENGDITVDGHLIVDDTANDWSDVSYKLLGTHQSPPLSKLLKQLNKHSDNFYAEMMLKTAAAVHYNIAGSTDLGISLVNDFATSIGLDTDKISMSDGSGMSATDLISTYALSKLLVAMRHRPDFSIFKNSLPIAGVDGSLQHRFIHSALKNRVIAKTGFVSGVRALSGYLKTKSNKTLIFSLVTNHYTTNTSYIDSVQEAILADLYARY